MFKISAKIQKINPSETLSITSRAKAMLKAGEDVVILAAGEPDYDTFDVVKDAAIKAIKDGFTKYTPSGGTVSLKEAIRRKLKNENGLDYSLDEIAVSCGAKHSLYNIFQVICNPGDEVIVITPYWLSYPEMITLAGAKTVFVKTTFKDGFKAKIKDIESAITKKTKAIIINSPSNPAGVVYDREDLEKIAKICLKKNILIVSDEIYEKVLFDGKKHISIASLSDDIKRLTIVVNGVSKSYSMTGWRIGYAAGDKDIIKAVVTLQSHSTSNPCSISQAAAECAMNRDLSGEMKKNRLEFQRRRDFIIKELSGEKKIKAFNPAGAFYVFCDISKCGLDSMTFAQKLLDEKKVAVIPGFPFGEDGFIRLSFATDLDTIAKGMKRIKELVNSL
ncbi:MAG: pyridoxal phosphate-dependent aminotransferase [Candidatus Omnitrophica bacterium]|nr:pyridoxal phosphate-dependent aminotransferase [Candidatus Omnitrophota bacterium]